MHSNEIEVHEISRVDAVIAKASAKQLPEFMFGWLRVGKEIDSRANCVPCIRAVSDVKDFVSGCIREVSCKRGGKTRWRKEDTVN